MVVGRKGHIQFFSAFYMLFGLHAIYHAHRYAFLYRYIAVYILPLLLSCLNSDGANELYFSELA